MAGLVRIHFNNVVNELSEFEIEELIKRLESYLEEKSQEDMKETLD